MTTKGQRTSSRVNRTDSSNAAKKTAARTPVPLQVTLPATITIKQLGDLMKVNPVDVIKQLMRNGVMAAINQAIDFDLAATVAPTFGYAAKREEKAVISLTATLEDQGNVDENDLLPRSPVVTILGHVDHGKTTLLDTIRSSRITAREVGGITQHIGAYQIEYKGQKIAFLDTPGHEAFTNIRARGARVTDIAVLVVAADDGVMPQTVEAINHAKAAKLPIVVAINKIDRPDSDPDQVKRQLLEHGLVPEEFGGDVIAVPISAKDNTGIDDLLENILVVAEVSDLKANFDQPATGVVIEVQLDKSRGPLATVLVQNGVLEVSDSVVAGAVMGRVRAMVNDLGLRVKQVGPSEPVEILGFSSLPQAGDKFYVTSDDKTARAVVAENIRKREDELNLAKALTLEEVVNNAGTGGVKELNLIIKADVQGSVEAVQFSLERLNNNQAKINILHGASGGVNESDVLLASASKAVILAFNASLEPGAERAAAQQGVEVRSYNIIYHLIEDVEKALKGILEPTHREVVIGRAEVRAVFSAGRAGTVAGSIVTDGRLSRDVAVRVIRKGTVIYEGGISSLRRFKDDVNEVNTGFECGIGVSGFEDFHEGDILEGHRRERA